MNLLPSLIFCYRNVEQGDRLRAFKSREILGYFVFFVGFVFEVLADWQKRLWRENEANKVRKDDFLWQAVSKVVF